MHAATGKPPPKEKWLIAITVMLATYVAVIDLTIVNVALPQMRGTFGVTLDAVTFPFLLMLGGRRLSSRLE